MKIVMISAVLLLLPSLGGSASAEPTNPAGSGRNDVVPAPITTPFTLSAALDRPLAMSAAGNNAWRFDLSLWMWLMGLEGDVGLRGFQSDVSASFGDILEASDSIFAFSGRLEVGVGPFGAYLDGMYAEIGAEDQSGKRGIADVDITFEQTIVDFGLMYRIAQWQPSGDAGNNRRQNTADIYAGARYVHLDLELAPANLPSGSRQKDWIDPIVGAKVVLPLSRQWHLAVNGDIGGFGAASDLTWSATAVLGYDFEIFNQDATFFVGYRAIGWDFSDGSGNDEFIFDVVQHGPLLGFNLKL